MKRRELVLAALVAILTVGLVGGCAKNADPAVSGPAAGKTLVAVKVVGFDATDYASTTKVGDVTQNRSQRITIKQEASDDRLAGAGEMIVNNDTRADGSSTGWGTFKFTNDRGTWEGDWSGAGEAKVSGNVYILTKLTGTGDYEGLVAYLTYVQPAESLGFADAVSAASGYIQQAK